MKKRYVHIGLPKCASTSLQLSFFPMHDELLHLGNGWNGELNRYVDAGVCRLAEVDLRFKRELAYDCPAAVAALAPHLERAEADDRVKAVGLSSEFLAFTLQNEIDVATKARRLCQLLGSDTLVVLVCREQIGLLKSLYLEMLKGGYPGAFQDFVSYTYMFQDRNWCLELCFDRLIDLYVPLVGPDNILVLPYEILKRDPAAFVSLLCRGLEISPTDIPLTKRNETPSDLQFFEVLRRLNERYPHEFGSPFYTPFHCSRLQAYFAGELETEVPTDRALDDYVRIHLARAAAEFRDKRQVPAIDLSCSPQVLNRLETMYAKANERLARQTGWDLRRLGYL
jgi:hypothetical protein